MEAWTRRALLFACAATLAHASPALPARPVVTPAAILPRTDSQVLGWYSASTEGTDTFYAPWAYDADITTYTTSGDYFRRCAVSSSCTMYTGCSNGYMMAAGTSSSCGAGGSSGALFCSYHVMQTNLAATSQMSWYWCDEAPLTGVTFYQKEPKQPDTSSLPSTRSASTTKTIAGGESASRSRTNTPAASASGSSPTASETAPPSGGSSTNVGAIAGGVVGGILGLALIGAAIFFLLYRKKKKTNAAASAPPTGYAPPPNQPGFPPASPGMGYVTSAYQANEAKPVGVQEGAFYSQPGPAPYPQGPYDPHMSYVAPGSPPPQEVAGSVPGSQPQYAAPQGAAQSVPHEMPSSPVRT